MAVIRDRDGLGFDKAEEVDGESDSNGLSII